MTASQRRNFLGGLWWLLAISPTWPSPQPHSLTGTLKHFEFLSFRPG